MRCSDTLGKFLRAKLNEILFNIGETSIKEIEEFDDLKSNILYDPLFNIEIVSKDSFRVSAPPSDICRSILRDYYHGFHRVKSQWESALILAQNEKIAWAVVSAYYCSFFGAIELLRICGKHALSFTAEEAQKCFGNLGGEHVEKIMEKRNFKGVISSDFSKIGYTSTGDKPHQAVWKLSSIDIFNIVPEANSSWVELSKFSNICKGQKGWELPSEIRNRWNYRKSDYYGEFGLSAANPFLKLMIEEGSVSSWIRRQVSVRNESESAASMAALANLFYLTICDTYNFGFLSARSIKND